MKNRQLLVVVGIIVLGLLLAYPLSRMFDRSPEPQVQPSAPSIERPVPPPQANDAGGDRVATAPENQPVGSPENAPAKPKIVVKTDVFRAGGREVSIGLVLANANGRSMRVTDVVRTRQPAPSLRIVDEAGKVLLDDSFQYG